MKDLFRENALKHLQSLEELPQGSLCIIEPPSWIWVLASLFLLASLFIWSVGGYVSLEVPAMGMILPMNSQMLSVVALQSGHVKQRYVQAGDSVKAGAVLATLLTPDTDENKNYLQNLSQDSERAFLLFSEEYQNRKAQLITQYQKTSAFLQESIKHHQEKSRLLQVLLARKNALFHRRYLTVADLEKAKEEFFNAKEELEKAKLALDQNTLHYQESINALDEKLKQYRSTWQSHRHAWEAKQIESQRGSEIKSLRDGMIVSSAVSPGDYVTQGKTLFTVMTQTSSVSSLPLDALVFLPQSEGKKVSAGMSVYVLPNTASVYEHGYIKGKVITVSDYPASKESVYAYLGNMTLVDQFFVSGAPLMTRIRLQADKKTWSGLAWTTKRGASFKINPGTLVSANVVTKVCSPLSLLLARC